TAVSQADSTKSGSASVTITAPPLAISISPTFASVQAGQSQQFTATVQNANNAAVTWQVNGATGGNATVGMISSSCLYTTPPVVPNPSTVSVTAVSQADTTKSASASVIITSSPPFASGVTLSPASVIGGNTSQATLTLSGRAPANGAVVMLSSSNTAAATVPASVTVTANTTSANFTVTTSTVSVST